MKRRDNKNIPTTSDRTDSKGSKPNGRQGEDQVDTGVLIEALIPTFQLRRF